MKRTMILAVVVLLGCLLIVSSGFAYDMNGCWVPDDCWTGTCTIQPYFIVPPDGTKDICIPAGSNIHIRGGWAACTKGLAQSFASRANFQFSLEGNEYLSRKESRQLWTQPEPLDVTYPCVNGSENAWVTYAIATAFPFQYLVFVVGARFLRPFLSHPLPITALP